ncbi:MAG: hypothetical protein ACRD1N_10530 [Terriglobia bacterium]
MAALIIALPLALVFILAHSAFADTITQTSADGRVQVIQTGAIVIHIDSSLLVYKHFDLKQRRVERVQLNQGSLPYQVAGSGPAGQQQIVNLWKKFGYTANVTDSSGKVTRVFDSYLDFFPPAGVGTFLESVPARTTLPILLDNGGADDIDFSDILTVQNDGGHLKITLSNGRVETGKFLMPTQERAIAHFMGITSHYSPASPDTYDFSLPLAQVKKIHFEQ